MTKKVLLAIQVILIYNLCFAQNQFKAIVDDQQSNDPLIGATLLIKGTLKGTTSDLNGNAILIDIPDGEQTLLVSFVGYDPHELLLSFPMNQTEPEKIALIRIEEDR